MSTLLFLFLEDSLFLSFLYINVIEYTNWWLTANTSFNICLNNNAHALMQKLNNTENTLNKHLGPPTPSSSGQGMPDRILSAVLTCDECRSKWRHLHALSWPNGRRWTWGDVGMLPATAWVRSGPCPCRGGSRHAGIPRRSTAARGWGVRNPECLRQCCNK